MDSKNLSTGPDCGGDEMTATTERLVPSGRARRRVCPGAMCCAETTGECEVSTSSSTYSRRGVRGVTEMTVAGKCGVNSSGVVTERKSDGRVRLVSRRNDAMRLCNATTADTDGLAEEGEVVIVVGFAKVRMKEEEEEEEREEGSGSVEKVAAHGSDGAWMKAVGEYECIAGGRR